MLDHYRELFAHLAWADAELYRALDCLPPVHQDQETLTKLHHVHTVMHMFLQVWRGDQPAHVPVTDFPSLASLRNYGRLTHELLEAHLATLDPDRLETMVHVPWFPGEPFQPTLRQTLQHVLAHTAYHRGQIAARLRQLGGETPGMDYIHWLWKGRPRAAWT